jgi:isoquinoline 1-oxidoreductase subunit alpha
VETFSFEVNGQTRQIEASGDTPLLWILRDTLGLYGTKYGCGIAQCGACLVHLDGQAVPSCAVAVSAVAGRNVVTIEGLSEDNSHPVQRAWIEEQVPQCGYCQSGQIMGAVALLQSNPNPSDDLIAETMNRNLCRCGTYPRVYKAIKRVARGGQ